jgi:hypothetical protein
MGWGYKQWSFSQYRPAFYLLSRCRQENVMSLLSLFLSTRDLIRKKSPPAETEGLSNHSRNRF